MESVLDTGTWGRETERDGKGKVPFPPGQAVSSAFGSQAFA